MPDRRWEIYTLTDPRTLRARYVGVTYHPERRYKNHLSSAPNGGTYKAHWIASLLRIGMRPIYLMIESGTGDTWRDRERFWIAAHRKFCKLVNGTDGGDGVSGHVHSDESRRKMSRSAQGKHPMTQVRRDALQRANSGRVVSDETRLAIAATKIGKPRSPETIAKMSAGMMGKKHTSETRAKMSRSRMGHTTSEETRRKISEAHLKRSERTQKEKEQANASA